MEKPPKPRTRMPVIPPPPPKNSLDPEVRYSYSTDDEKPAFGHESTTGKTTSATSRAHQLLHVCDELDSANVDLLIRIAHELLRWQTTAPRRSTKPKR